MWTKVTQMILSSELFQSQLAKYGGWRVDICSVFWIWRAWPTSWSRRRSLRLPAILSPQHQAMRSHWYRFLHETKNSSRITSLCMSLRFISGALKSLPLFFICTYAISCLWCKSSLTTQATTMTTAQVRLCSMWCFSFWMHSTMPFSMIVSNDKWNTIQTLVMELMASYLHTASNILALY